MLANHCGENFDGDAGSMSATRSGRKYAAQDRNIVPALASAIPTKNQVELL
jgi:hypothetical protein